MIKTVLAATVALSTIAFTAPMASAQSGPCGFYAFAGAFQNYNNAIRRARNVGGNVWDLDASDSPNAGKGFFVVAQGPGSRSQAQRWARQYRSYGVSGAYVARRCMYAS
ncbi:MAG: hypothetical protein AAGF28_11215 [Pseudomonadota bacterium]